jgi:hypothetical protein
MGTPAWEWIKQLESRANARQGMQKLRLHYDGPDKRKARVSEAENDIEKAHYSRERSFPFEKYVTKLTGAFQVLAHYNEPYPDDKKIRTLLGKINSNDPHINAGIAHVRSNALMMFDEAVSYLADIIRLAPSSQTQAIPNNPARRVAASNTQGRGHGRFGRFNSGRSVVSNNQSGRSNALHNPERPNFVPHEAWGLLTPAQRAAIARERNENESSSQQQHGGYGRGGRGFGYRGGRGRYDPNRGGRMSYYGGRNINAINVERRTDSSEMSHMTDTIAQSPQNNAGHAFGRSSYNIPNNQNAGTVSNNSSRTNDESISARYNRNPT